MIEERPIHTSLGAQNESAEVVISVRGRTAAAAAVSRTSLRVFTGLRANAVTTPCTE